ncbi:MAG TPA: type II toxin-antitoxin system Phd/YefM family antitoxin [Actinomycetota bacterium]|nr:type II toxin-antitoxin system Phd/YefM family antitoxin [Actinomycetota bacterium]
MRAEQLVNVSEVKGRLYELIRELASRPVFLLLRHGKPVAALVGYDTWARLIERVEDLEDRIAVYEAHAEEADMKVPWEKVKAEAGLMIE